jgi:hypothetical protein
MLQISVLLAGWLLPASAESETSLAQRIGRHLTKTASRQAGVPTQKQLSRLLEW